MRFFFYSALAFLIISCGSGNNTDSSEYSVALNFIAEPESLLEVSEGNPIERFVTDAEEEAVKTVAFTPSNAQHLLNEAANFKHTVIVTGNHTIVTFVNDEDCKQSGSWGACMPMGEGYIKKGELQYQKDYINNVIGLPDGQERRIYFFE